MEKIIQFRCGDGLLIEVPDDVIFQPAKKMHKYLTDAGRKQRGVICVVLDSLTLIRVIEFLTKHKGDHLISVAGTSEGDDEAKSIDHQPVPFKLSDWDRKYLSHHVKIVPELIAAAVYMDIDMLVNAARTWIEERHILAFSNPEDRNKVSFEPVNMEGVRILKPVEECKKVIEKKVAEKRDDKTKDEKKNYQPKWGRERLSGGIVKLKQDETAEKLKELTVDYGLLQKMNDELLEETASLNRQLATIKRDSCGGASDEPKLKKICD